MLTFSPRGVAASPARARRLAVVVFGSFAAMLLAPAADAQQAGTRVFHLRETAGIRRTQYPATVTVQMPKAALSDVSHVRVMNNSAEVPAQFTARATWDDGSVQTLDVDLNATLDPEEDRRYELQFGPGVTTSVPLPRGLAVTDDGATVKVGNLTFSKSGNPLLASASYRGEGIGAGSNGLTITDQSGVRLDLSKAQGGNLEVLKAGPLMVVLKFTATIPVDPTVSIPVELLLEMPSSKTWLRTTATVIDRTRRLRDIAIERPYAFSGFPVLWDFGTDSGTYGVFRAAADTVTLTQTTTASGSSTWKVETGPLNQRRAVETSAGTRNKNAGGWGHLQDSKTAVAFGISRFGKDPGTYTVAFNGSGAATYRFAPATPAPQHTLTVFEHFVATPVAIGAATNATAMLTPLSVTVER